MSSDDRLSQQPTIPPSLPPSVSDAAHSSTATMSIRVVAFVFFVYIFWPFTVVQLLLAAGFRPSPREHLAFMAGPVAAAAAEQTVQRLPMIRLGLLANGFAFPLQVVSVLLLLPRFAGIRLEQIGLTTRRFGRNGLWGVVGWLLLTPVCRAVFQGVVALYGAEGASGVHEHPFQQLALEGLTPLEWFLLVFSATISAPVMEEMLFRGALQSWLERRPWAAHIAMILAFVASLPMKADEAVAAWSQGSRALLLLLTPVLFVLALILIYLVVCRLSRGAAAPAVFASSALFAAIHSFAWPSPVPLFVLAFGLGWLAQRTRSLVGPMVLHGLFNAVSCAMLFWK